MTWEQQNIEGGWEPQKKLEVKPETSFEKYHRETEESRQKAFKLGNEMAAGHRPMFMTGPEIKQHYAPYEGDKNMITDNTGAIRTESTPELWDRKLKESKMTGEERHGKEAFKRNKDGSWPTLSGPDLAKRGIKAKSSIESVSKEHGAPQGHVDVEFKAVKGRDPQIFGGHHRIALAAEQFKDHLFPVKHSDTLAEAQRDPKYK